MTRLLVAVIAGLAFALPADCGFAVEFGDIELSFYGLGSWPRDEPIFNQGTTVPGSIKSGFGGGVKVGLFPHFTNRMLGVELDSNAHGGAISFQNLADGRHSGLARSNILVANSMVNLVMRYPGDTILPYIGIGAGLSHGVLLNPNIAGRADQDFESARAFAYQALAGTEVMLSRRVFLFGEYRYFSANYHWEGLALDFRAHYGLAGFGLRF
jgi:opacity protein-like surface antigen